MTPETLLAALAPLTHAARMRQMVDVGRQAAGDPSVAATLAQLEQGGMYERWFALQSCFGSGDGAQALRALADPSRQIRGLALVLVALAGDDAQVAAALAQAPYAVRLVLLRRLRSRGRLAPIDAFLATLGRGDPDFERLLPFGSPALVAGALEDALGRAAGSDWRRLARVHPRLAAATLARALAAADSTDARVVWQANAALPVLAEHDPDGALRLVAVLAARTPLARLSLQELVVRRPAALADLVLGAEDRAAVSFAPVAARLDLDRLLALLARRGDTIPVQARWFGRLPPAGRAAIYQAGALGWRDADAALPHAIVALLPRELREAEGRRHLALPALATRPLQRLPYATFLPWDEARAVLDPTLRNPDPDLRVAAWAALAASVRYQRDHLADLLALVRARRNEQDPVRRTMLEGLADLPPGMWRLEHLEVAGGAIREALDAADLSAASARAAERLVLALLPFYPDWSATWLATLVQERGQFHFYAAADRLSDADVRRIAPALLPVLAAWESRERESHLLNLAGSLGRRLRVFPELVAIVERVVQSTPSSWLAEQGLNLLLEH
ncbi:MAG TPA: hypothetical protein VKY74_11870, partial [Chloroflexia bacterium]|nr:hypothetical protein [Chloroflexia bacterium]